MNCRIVIPSARASNLIPCVQSILMCDPTIPASTVIAVDDGARAESEAALPPITWVSGVRPFIFARNVNLGIVAAERSDVIVLNDDARLVTGGGFTQWVQQMRGHRGVGLCSAGICGHVCNPSQVPADPPSFRDEPRSLAFVCVYLPRATIDRVGLLDERYIGYGFEDFDYCRRVNAFGLRLAIWDGCVVDHAAESTYRTRPDFLWLFELNRRIYYDKWEACDEALASQHS
jgi:GT2 family glycosyltransferase